MIGDKIVFSCLIPIIVSILVTFFTNIAFELPSKTKDLTTVETLFLGILFFVLIIILFTYITICLYLIIKESEQKSSFYEDYIEIIEEVIK